MASWLLQVFNTHVRRIAGRGYSYFHLYIFVFIYLCVALPLSKMKNDTELKFGTHSPKLHLITVFFFFSKIGPRGSPPPRETAMSRGFSAYLLDCLVLFSKSTWCESPVEDIPIFTYEYSLYGTSWPNEKLYRPEICHKHYPRLYLKTGFLFFRKSYPKSR